VEPVEIDILIGVTVTEPKPLLAEPLVVEPIFAWTVPAAGTAQLTSPLRPWVVPSSKLMS
jgi:hypothetical protein